MRDCAHAGRHLHAPVTRGRVMSIPALQRPLGATRIQEKTHDRPPTCAPPATAAIAPLVDLAGRNRGPARRLRRCPALGHAAGGVGRRGERPSARDLQDRNSVVWGKDVSVCVDSGGGGYIKKKNE